MSEGAKILAFTIGAAVGLTGIGMGVQAYFYQVAYSDLQDDKASIEHQAQMDLETANQENERLRQQLANIPSPIVLPPVTKIVTKKEKPIVVQIPPSIDSCRALRLPDDVLQRLSR